MKQETKNHAHSVRAKLLNLMKFSRKDYMYLLVRYFNERLLYRISISKYRNNFILKGGTLMYALDGLNARPTVDIDFIGNSISRDRESLKQSIESILRKECLEDGVVFDFENISTEEIAVDKRYPGTRFSFYAKMGTIVQRMSIDIGFGDIITPAPQSLDFPLLLPDLPSVNILAYSLETVIAEKFHAMIDLDLANSRMKDFFDCYQILLNKHVDEAILKEAILKTFSNRQLPVNPELKLFTAKFCSDSIMKSRWHSFLRKIKWEDKIGFEEVLKEISTRLQPYYIEYIATITPPNKATS